MDKLNTFWFCLFMCFFSLSVSADNEAKVMEFDFGKVTAGSKVSHSFEFKEKIKSAVGLCDCVKVKVSKEKKSAQGMVSIVEAEFNSQGYQGQVSQEVFVLADDNQLTKLELKALVVSDAEATGHFDAPAEHSGQIKEDLVLDSR